MNRFSRVSIAGFRRLVNVNLEMRPLAVLIGANGVGKTSFLDAVSLLAASAGGQLSAKINELGGPTALLTYDKADSIALRLTMDVPNDAPLVYSLRIVPAGSAYALEEETLSQQRQIDVSGRPFKHIESRGPSVHYYDPERRGLVRPTWDYNPFETSLSQVPKMFPDPEGFRHRLASWTLYHILDVRPRAPVRLPQPVRPAPLPGRDGEDLVSCLYSLRETDRDRFEAFQDTLRDAFPGFERLDFPPVAAGTLAMTWKDTNFAKPMYTHQLSEGTLRFLWLTALLQSRELTAMTLLDEPEVSLHPELLSILAALMRDASLRTNLVVATHSDMLVRFLEPHEVIVMDMREDGSASLTWADTLDLEKWLEDYTLDEVWRMGRMGGRA